MHHVIMVEPDIEATLTPVFDPLFDLEALVNRDGDIFQIWTNQGHFWEPGGTIPTLMEDVKIEFSIDGKLIDKKPFVFWRNSGIQEVHDDDGNVIGSYLWAPMCISLHMNTVPLGDHILAIKISKPSDLEFEKTWNFTVTAHEPRRAIPPEIRPTAENLIETSPALPDFLDRVDTTPHYLEKWMSGITSQEGICLLLNGVTQPANITIQIDETMLEPDAMSVRASDQVGYYVACADTDDFADGLHLATVFT